MGKDNLNRFKRKHGLRGKFSGDRKRLILLPIFKDNKLKDVAMPRGYSSFSILDIFGSYALIIDENEKLSIFQMEVK